MRTSPCYGCEDRYVGCHSKCGKYIDFQSVHEEEKETIRKNKEKESARQGYMTSRQFANALRSNKNRVFKQTIK